MYVPAHFAEDRLPVLQALMQSYPLATLVTLTADGIVANHIPLKFTLVGPAAAASGAPPAAPALTADGSDPGALDVDARSSEPDPLAPDISGGPALVGVLRGHVARANPIWRDFDPGTDVLAIFQGPQAYISPSWYATKKEHGRVVPTWNYAVVHAHGRLLVRDDAAWAHAMVDELTREHESTRPKPWAVSDAPDDYIAQLTRAIVGIEIPVTRLAGKWKTSGNQPVGNRAGAAQGLAASASDNDRRMAALIAAHDAPSASFVSSSSLGPAVPSAAPRKG